MSFRRALPPLHGPSDISNGFKSVVVLNNYGVIDGRRGGLASYSNRVESIFRNEIMRFDGERSMYFIKIKQTPCKSNYAHNSGR